MLLASLQVQGLAIDALYLPLHVPYIFYMWSLRSLHVVYAWFNGHLCVLCCTQRALNVHSTCSQRALKMHSMCTQNALNVHSISTSFAPCIMYYVFYVCIVYVFFICSLCVRYIYIYIYIYIAYTHYIYNRV